MGPSKGNSPTGDGIGRDKSGHGMNPTERGALTLWRRHRKGQSQDTERIRPTEGHSHPGDGIWRDMSGHEMNPTERGALTNWKQHQEGQFKSGHGNNPTEREALTLWRWHREKQVRTRKESDETRSTHELETASQGTGQDRERIRQNEGRSRTGDSIGRDISGHGKNTTGRGALTLWRRHCKGQVRTWNESDRARATHILKTASGWTCQDTERIRPSEGYSPTGDSIGRDKSGHE